MASADERDSSGDAVMQDDQIRVNRRVLLKSGAGALPAVLSLQSGAALAQSSNLIAASPTEMVDSLGRTLCVDKSSVIPIGEYSRLYDLGDPPYAVVKVLRGEVEGRLYYLQKSDRDIGQDVHPGYACELGGQFWVKPTSGPWETVELNQGFVASNGALYSFAGDYESTLM